MDPLTSSIGQFYEELRGHMKEMNQGEQFYDVLMDFIHAVDWSERWIQGIVAMHIGLALSAVLFRKNMSVQLGIFVFGAVLILFAEQLNALGAEFWEEFARQPYFDKRGAFYSAVVSCPLVFVMIFVLINYLLHVVTTMVRLKRKEVQWKARQRKQDGDPKAE